MTNSGKLEVQYLGCVTNEVYLRSIYNCVSVSKVISPVELECDSATTLQEDRSLITSHNLDFYDSCDAHNVIGELACGALQDIGNQENDDDGVGFNIIYMVRSRGIAYAVRYYLNDAEGDSTLYEWLVEQLVAEIILADSGVVENNELESFRLDCAKRCGWSKDNLKEVADSITVNIMHR